MSAPEEGLADRGTTADDYSQTYYAGHLGGQDYGWESDAWREFFVRVAARVTAITAARTVLDVGCARGLFVQALRQGDVDARGFDVSDHAVSSAHPDVRDHLWVQSATAPIEGRYDLVTCIEVLEHMAPDEADLAIDRMCAAGDQILFSSSPADFAEPTHVNVRPTADWVTAFAERGYFRRTDVSLDFLTGWAVLLSRQPLNARDIVDRYEREYAVLHGEVLEKRSGLLEAHRELGRMHALRNDPDAEVRLERTRVAQLEQVAAAEGELNHVRRELDLARDRAEALERLAAELEHRLADSDKRTAAALARLRSVRKQGRKRVRNWRGRVRRARRQLRRQRARAQTAERRLVELQASRSYRLAAAMTGPRRLWSRTVRAIHPRA